MQRRRQVLVSRRGPLQLRVARVPRVYPRLLQPSVWGLDVQVVIRAAGDGARDDPRAHEPARVWEAGDVLGEEGEDGEVLGLELQDASAGVDGDVWREEGHVEGIWGTLSAETGDEDEGVGRWLEGSSGGMRRGASMPAFGRDGRGCHSRSRYGWGNVRGMLRRWQSMDTAYMEGMGAIRRLSWIPRLTTDRLRLRWTLPTLVIEAPTNPAIHESCRTRFTEC